MNIAQDRNISGTWLDILISFDYNTFSNFVQNADFTREHYESYSLSPAYYQFTGRNGAWLHIDDNAAVVVCTHPNRPEEILLFPEISQTSDYRLTHKVLDQLLMSYKIIKLARFTDIQKEAFLCSADSYSHLSLKPVIEMCLDWQYPAYVLNTQNLITRTGAGFERIRQRLRKLDRDAFSARPLTPSIAQNELRNHIKRWASNFNHDGYTFEDLISPASKLIDIFCSHPERLSGQVIYIDNKIESYCIWENPVHPDLPANELAISSSNYIKGLSEWQMVTMCAALHSHGINTVNIGGSETHSLDRYKRKFSPVQTFALNSIEVSIKP